MSFMRCLRYVPVQTGSVVNLIGISATFLDSCGWLIAKAEATSNASHLDVRGTSGFATDGASEIVGRLLGPHKEARSQATESLDGLRQYILRVVAGGDPESGIESRSA